MVNIDRLTPDTRPVLVKMPVELIRRLDRAVDKLRTRTGKRYTRADLIRDGAARVAREILDLREDGA